MDRRRIPLASAFAASVALGLAIVVACGPGNLSDLTRGRPPQPPPTKDAGDGCQHASPPPPNPDASNEGIRDEVVFALDNMRLDTSTAFTNVSLPPAEGLDLDQSCTCPHPPSCAPIGDASVPCDADGGVDNATGGLLTFFAAGATSLFNPEYIHSRIKIGIYSLLISLVEWNGTPNDPSVQVTLRTSTGIDNGITDQNATVLPRFDGTDQWNIDPTSVVPSAPPGVPCTTNICRSITADLKGYVVDGTVVAHFDEIRFPLGGGVSNVIMPYIGVTLVAKISEDRGLLRLAGELSGRFPAQAIIEAATKIGVDPEDRDATATTLPSICANKQTFDLFKSLICNNSDLAARPSLDNQDASCAALSEGMRFTAVVAKMGRLRGAELSSPPGCTGPEFSDYSCPK